ncbi:unnamed protein product [Dracunculus medinensis]|uniref:C2H2-type domain-containing protein n=1 Tax=Dracunculus medinensis TaxID=318479 RepID=A0A0N4U8Q8_DRAME|nr:unnamed protein product [Dracunculus medinensis]
MSTRRKQLKPKAIKDGEASEECDENCDRSIDEQNGKRIKLELNGNADANDFESVSSGSRPTSTSIINSTSYAATDFCNMHCIFCNKPFSDVTALQNHIITDHMNMKIFQKGAENSSANAVKVFLMRSSNQMNVNGDIASSLVCQQCDAKFTNFVNFGQHMRIHLKNDGDAKCHLCSSTFGNSQLTCAIVEIY